MQTADRQLELGIDLALRANANASTVGCRFVLLKERIRAERSRERLLQEQQERRRLSCRTSYLAKVTQGDAAVSLQVMPKSERSVHGR